MSVGYKQECGGSLQMISSHIGYLARKTDEVRVHPLSRRFDAVRESRGPREL